MYDLQNNSDHYQTFNSYPVETFQYLGAAFGR